MSGVRRPIARSAALAAAGILIGMSALAAEPYVTYDTFSTVPLNAARWMEGERVRDISFEGLRLFQRDWGGMNSDSGRGAVSWGDNLTVPGPVTQMRGQIRVDAMGLTSCAANPTPSRVRARLIGSFFNTGNPVPGSALGDVLGQIQLVRQSDDSSAVNVLKVQGNLLVCTHADCSTSTPLGSTVDLGTVFLGVTANVGLEWDKANRRFRFLRDNGATTLDIDYTVSDAAAAGLPFKAVGLRIEPANCLSGPRTTAFMTARFDSLSINSKAKFPDFVGP